MNRMLVILTMGWALAGTVAAPRATAQSTPPGGVVAAVALADAATPTAAPDAPGALRPTMASALLAPSVSLAELAGPAPEIRPVAAARGRSGVPLMAAGGVLFVAGAIVGGDAGVLLMVGGAGLGAYGIYQYTR